MKGPEDVAITLRLHALGWGVRRIAQELHTSWNIVREYLRRVGWRAYQRSSRKRKLDGLGAWLTSEFRKHRGNADVVRQELEKVFGIRVSLRTVERAVAGFRQELRAVAIATVRFETPPGKQLQIDFGERRVSIAGQSEKVFLFVATLGYSRRIFVRAFSHERQSAWFEESTVHSVIFCVIRSSRPRHPVKSAIDCRAPNPITYFRWWWPTWCCFSSFSASSLPSS